MAIKRRINFKKAKSEMLETKDCLQALLDCTEGLGDWEINFLDSLNKRLERNEVITAAQNNVLVQLYDRRILGV